MWLSRTLLNLTKSEVADAGGKPAHDSMKPWGPRLHHSSTARLNLPPPPRPLLRGNRPHTNVCCRSQARALLQPLKLPFLMDHLNFHAGANANQRWSKTNTNDILRHIIDRVNEQVLIPAPAPAPESRLPTVPEEGMSGKHCLLFGLEESSLAYPRGVSKCRPRPPPPSGGPKCIRGVGVKDCTWAPPMGLPTE